MDLRNSLEFRSASIPKAINHHCCAECHGVFVAFPKTNLLPVNEPPNNLEAYEQHTEVRSTQQFMRVSS